MALVLYPVVLATTAVYLSHVKYRTSASPYSWVWGLDYLHLSALSIIYLKVLMLTIC